MPLDFECNQDPRAMKTVKGKKFCENCREHVYDVRRKSIDKILELGKEKKNCCFVIYDHQLEELEEKILSEKIQKGKSNQNALPYAAGLAAFSFLSHGAIATESNKIAAPFENTIQQSINEELVSKREFILPDPASYNGRLVSRIDINVKNRELNLGYYDPQNKFKTILTFTTDTSGAFSFSFTKAQLKAATGKKLIIKGGKEYVRNYAFNLDGNGAEIILSADPPKKHAGKKCIKTED
ncbi:MAG: hypothetical protein IAF38_12245 [Bacteroidia bacterium]|nr:hypothetical protein [Bacteroidia bacterium]